VFPEAELEPVLPVDPAPVLPEAEEEPEPVEPVVLVVLVEAVDVVLGGALLVGTVRVGAPAVLAEVELPPPQAEMPTASARPAAKAASELVMRARREVTAPTSGPEGVHPTSAVRAVIQVLLSELVAPVAEAQVLHRPRELRGGGGEGKEDGHGLEWLVGLAVKIGAARLGLDDHFAPGGRGPQAVLLVEPHRFDATSGPVAAT
jgi:hypothetical protein